ncbi:MAG TPA: carbohydrate-binding family 9-like protein [Prolixibacteraceae bacterium]
MAISITEKLRIPFIGDPLLSDYQQVANKLKSEGVKALIEKINWSDYPWQPIVELFAGYSGFYLWLCYEVRNDHFRADATADHQSVWEDSCVEFFMTTDLKPNEAQTQYRNFEFNALGTCLSAYGNKAWRVLLSSGEMQRILRFPGKTAAGWKEGEPFDWQLAVALPLDLLGLVPGNTFRANFYKCGDLTLKPHFLSWNGIVAAEPDFHLPQFFGEAQLLIK